MPQDKVLICRSCKIAAHTKFVDRQMASIACPSCGLLVEGDAAHEMYLKQARYLAMQEAQNLIRGAFSKGGAFKHQPSRINKPRSLAGKPLAGFRATPSRRVPVLYGMVVYAIRFNNQLLHRQSTLGKRRLGENRGFPSEFLEAHSSSASLNLSGYPFMIITPAKSSV